MKATPTGVGATVRRLALELASWQRLHRPTRLIAREETLGADRQSWGALVADDNNGEALWGGSLT